MDLGFAEKVGIFLGLILTILFGSIGNSRTILSAAGGGLGEQYVFMTKWGTNGTASGQFRYPDGIGVDSRQGNVYVADTNNNRIQMFDDYGKFITTWGYFGVANGQFNNP